MKPIWKILVIDDTAPLAELIAHSFNSLGEFDVHTECDPLSAVERVHLEKPDLIILDVQMPGLDGFGVLRGLRNEGVATPIIMCSSSATPWHVRNAYAAGCNSFLEKPTSLDGYLCMAEQVISYWNLNALPSHVGNGSGTADWFCAEIAN